MSYKPFNHFRTLDEWMPILTIYCDDSGTDHGNRAAVVAGYIGQVKQWEKLEKEWINLMKDFGVTLMRRSDLESFKGEYAEWNEERRTTFVKRAHLLIRAHTKIPIGSAVIKEDFNTILHTNTREQFGGVYGWCIQDCIAAVRTWCAKHHYVEPIQWVFEAGTDGYGQVQKMFEELSERKEWQIAGWSFQNKEIVPLQCADILAYEMFKQVENQIVDRGIHRPMRRSLRDLVHMDDERYLNYWDKYRLTDWRKELDSRGFIRSNPEI